MLPEEIEQLPYRPCVGVVLVNSSGLIFSGQRIDSDVPAWQMPQGGIDIGEEPADAALRELQEETGVTAELVTIQAESAQWLAYDLPADIVPKVWKGRYRGQEQKWFLLRFNGTDADINIVTDQPEFSEWKWISAKEMLASIVSFKKGLYSRVLNEFGDRL